MHCDKQQIVAHPVARQRELNRFLELSLAYKRETIRDPENINKFMR
jgi:hypothetical protein